MHSLEVAIENKVKSYIESNLESTIRRSEKSLINYFDETRIVDTGEEIWESIAETKLSKYFTAIDDNDMEDFIVIGYDFWLHFRKTKYFKGIYTELVKYFFKKYGDKELDVILEDIGVTVSRPIHVMVDDQDVKTQSQALVNHSASKHYRVPRPIIHELVARRF